MEQEAVSLVTLMSALREGVEQLFPEKIWVRAEVAQVNYHGTGHCYMDLVQNENGSVVAKVRAAIWRLMAARIIPKFESQTGKRLAAGMQVLLRVQVNCSEVYGVSLIVDQIDSAFTIGQQELIRKQTIERLVKEHLIDAQKGLTLPSLPYRLAVISSGDAAGYGDFMNHISGNQYGFVFHADLFPATMQGESSPQSVADAIHAVVSSPLPYDAVLVLRGGGSAQDLICFDDYVMAAAIAKCPVPVITAIGHDRDYHIADMVAYDYVKTPTALADYFISIYKAEDDRILALEKRISTALGVRMTQMTSKLDSVVSRIRNVSLLKIERSAAQVSLLEARIASADPRQILSRGYTLATDARGVVLKSSAGVKAGDSVSVRFSDGMLDCEVKRTIENKIQ